MGVGGGLTSIPDINKVRSTVEKYGLEVLVRSMQVRPNDFLIYRIHMIVLQQPISQ